MVFLMVGYSFLNFLNGVKASFAQGAGVLSLEDEGKFTSAQWCIQLKQKTWGQLSTLP
jgi:hypothetical protein